MRPDNQRRCCGRKCLSYLYSARPKG